MMVKMTENVAAGMEYLESKKCIHRLVQLFVEQEISSNKLKIFSPLTKNTHFTYKYSLTLLHDKSMI